MVYIDILCSSYFFNQGAIISHGGGVLSLSVYIIFGIVTLVVFTITSILGVYREPITIKKEIILVAVLLFLLPITASVLGFVNRQSLEYSKKIKRVEFIFPERFSSIDECKSRHIFEEAGFCYGYFASKNNDMNLCAEYIDKYVDPLLDKNYININCVTGYSVYKNDPSICSTIKDADFQAKCEFNYYLAKKDFNKCRAITYKPFDGFSFSGDKCHAWHIGIICIFFHDPTGNRTQLPSLRRMCPSR